MKKIGRKAIPLAAALLLSMPVAMASPTDAAVEAAQNKPQTAAATPVDAQGNTITKAEEDRLIEEAKKKHTPGSYVESNDVFQIARLRREATAPDYRLFKGDTVSLLVIGFPDGIGVNQFTVGKDGFVQLPYVGSVKFEGLTLDEAKKVIMDSLGQYLKIPDMSLMITNYGPRRVYVMGDVAKPGIIDMSIDNMNAYAALAAAGGWTSRGLSSGVQIMRVKGDTMYWRKLNMRSFAKRHDLTQNVVIEDGDMLYVPSSRGIKWQQDILPWFNAWALYKGLTD